MDKTNSPLPFLMSHKTKTFLPHLVLHVKTELTHQGTGKKNFWRYIGVSDTGRSFHSCNWNFGISILNPLSCQPTPFWRIYAVGRGALSYWKKDTWYQVTYLAMNVFGMNSSNQGFPAERCRLMRSNRHVSLHLPVVLLSRLIGVTSVKNHVFRLKTCLLMCSLAESDACVTLPLNASLLTWVCLHWWNVKVSCVSSWQQRLPHVSGWDKDGARS